MSNANDFVIENGVLIKYTGKDTVVEIPEGITAIDDVYKEVLEQAENFKKYAK